MSLIEQIVARAKANKQRIVLPEAEEERTLIAADKVLEQEIADHISPDGTAKMVNMESGNDPISNVINNVPNLINKVQDFMGKKNSGGDSAEVTLND